MPQNTPRGYTYPCYSDPVNFPAQIQDLAQDIDSDVQSIITNIGDARNTPPSCRVTGTTTIVMAANAAQFITFQTEGYDNANMFTAPSNTVTTPVEGLYLISARLLFLAGGGVNSAGITLNTFFRSLQSRQGVASSNNTVNVHTLAFCPAATAIQVFAESSTGNDITTRTLTVTRVTGSTLL